MKRGLFLWGPVAAMMIAIYNVSGIPNLTDIPGGFSDKTAHFWAYGALAALAFRATAGGRWSDVTARTGFAAWAIAAAYGASDEFHQTFVPGRFAGVDDWVADALGAAAAVVVVLVVRRLIASREV